MLTLNDGRSELWQWDTGRTLAVDADCSQVHFSNKVFGRSIDVDVVDGVAIIPDIMLQTDKDLNAWAFVGTAENGYTKISKTFKVNRRNKPADYVFTPPDQTSIEEIKKRLEYLEQNPVESPVQSVNGQTGAVELNAKDVGAISVETDPTVPGWAKQPEKPTYTASEVGALPDTYTPPVDSTLTQSGQAADAAEVGNKINELKGDIVQDHSRLFNESENLIDNDNMINGYYTASTDTPTIVENSGLKCILVEIDGNTEYTISSMSYSSVFYDKYNNKISGLPTSNDTVTFTSPVNAKYVSVSAYTPYLTGLMMVKGDVLPSEFIQYKNESAMDVAENAKKIAEHSLENIYHVGAGQKYTNFTKLIKKLQDDNSRKIIYIHAGEYDIFEEYGGSEYAREIADTEWRKWSAVIPPNTSIIGLGRVIFKFLPNASDCTINSVSVLSPINTSGSCNIENITIMCKNCRYGIHDETSGIEAYYYARKKFNNVRVYRYANDDGLSTPYGHAYAAGFDVGVHVTFEHCIFVAPALAWSVHDRVVDRVANNGGFFLLKDSIFKGVNYAGIQFINNNTNPSETIVYIIDCDVSKLRIEKKSKDSSQRNGFNIASRLCKVLSVITDFDDDNDYPYTAYNTLS